MPTGQSLQAKKGSIEQQILPLTEHLRLKYRKRFDEDLLQRAGPQKHTNAQSQHLRMQKASAWYYVTYHHAADDLTQDRRLSGGRTRKVPLLLSFAWLMHDVLCLIKRQAQSSTQP